MNSRYDDGAGESRLMLDSSMARVLSYSVVVISPLAKRRSRMARADSAAGESFRSVRVSRAMAYTARATMEPHAATMISIPAMPAELQYVGYQPIMLTPPFFRDHQCVFLYQSCRAARCRRYSPG